MSPARRAIGASVSTLEDILAAVRFEIESRGEELLLAPDALAPRVTQELWLSPTKTGGLRYGEVCIVRTSTGAVTLVRASSYRAAKKSPDKRPYRRWHGIDLLGFLASGVRREIRIVQVLKGSRC